MIHKLGKNGDYIMAQSRKVAFNFKQVWLSETNNWLYNLNRSGKYDLAEMDGQTKNYEFVLCSSCPEIISECLDDQGCLNNNCTLIDLGGNGDIALTYDPLENGGGFNVFLPTDTIVYDSETEEINIKACFLRQKQTGYVIAYDIWSNILPVANMAFPTSGIVLKIEIERR